jgi:hypothetical protein
VLGTEARPQSVIGALSEREYALASKVTRLESEVRELSQWNHHDIMPTGSTTQLIVLLKHV